MCCVSFQRLIVSTLNCYPHFILKPELFKVYIFHIWSMWEIILVLLFFFVTVLNIVAVTVLPNNIFDATDSLRCTDTHFACVCVCVCVCDELSYWNGTFDHFLPQFPCSCIYFEVVLSHVYKLRCVPQVTDVKKSFGDTILKGLSLLFYGDNNFLHLVTFSLFMTWVCLIKNMDEFRC